MNEIKIVYISTDDLKEYENNPRNNDSAVDKVAASIDEFGFKYPIIIDKNNVIVAGHTRLKAARKLGLDVVPCSIADDLTDEQIKAFRLVDNKTAELSGWNFEKLETELEMLSEKFNMEDFGFDFEPIEVMQKEREDLSERINEIFQVVIECNDELEQEELYNRLAGEGFKCRVLTL